MYLFKCLLAALATLAGLLVFAAILSRWPAATILVLMVLGLTIIFAANGAFSDSRK